MKIQFIYAFLYLMASTTLTPAMAGKSVAGKKVIVGHGKSGKGKGSAPFTGTRKLKTFCYMNEATGEIVGDNIDERLPLASVSKVFTTLFAVLKNAEERSPYENAESADHRLPFDKKTITTKVYYSETRPGSKVYNVHIQGAKDPYFMRDSMHWLISKLNQAGVYKINELTFDENFKYLHESEKKFKVGKIRVDPVSGTEDLDFPSSGLVALELQQIGVKVSGNGKQKKKEKILEVLNFYERTKLIAAEKHKVILVDVPVFNPTSVRFTPSAIFVKPANAKEFPLASPSLLKMVKQMNWFSNNQAANNMFQYSGGISSFNDIFYGKMKFTENDLLFKNGSGQNSNVARTSHDYNEATCRTVVRVLHGLKINLERQHIKLENALAVVGGDHLSTVSGKTYDNPTTHLSVIAKSGTVAMSVGLAGMISAQKGNFFFYYNIEPYQSKSSRGREVEAQRCRNVISRDLNALVLNPKLGGGKPLAYTPAFYDPDRVDDEDKVSDEESKDSDAPTGGTFANQLPLPVPE